MNSRRYLITCGTSRIGLEVCKSIARTKKIATESIILGTRNLANGFKWACALQEEYSSILFGAACIDLKCPKSCQRAFVGVTDLILLTPPEVNDLYKYCQMMSEFAHLNGVERVTLVSPVMVENSEYEKQVFEVCNFLQALRLSFNVIRFHPIILDNIQYQMPAFLEGKFKSAIKPEARFSYTCCSDVGLAVAYASALKDFRGKDAYYITGPDTITLNDFVSCLNKIIPLQLETISPEHERDLMYEKGSLYGEHDFIETIVDVHRNINSGNATFQRVTDDYKVLAGKKPTSSHDFVQRLKPTLTLLHKQAKSFQAQPPGRTAGSSATGGISQTISEGIQSARKSLEVS